MQGAYDLFYELFLTDEISGYFGPMALIIVGYVIAMKYRNPILNVLYFVVEWLFISHYLDLVSATPAYWWQIFIILFGGLFTLVFPLWDRHK